MIEEFKLKMMKNPKNNDNINYYIIQPIEFEIYTAKTDEIKDNKILISLNIRKHLYIKKLLDYFIEKIKYINPEIEPNCYYLKENKEEFIIRIVNLKKKNIYKNSVCNVKLRIKNIWIIKEKSGTIFELIDITDITDITEQI